MSDKKVYVVVEEEGGSVCNLGDVLGGLAVILCAGVVVVGIIWYVSSEILAGLGLIKSKCDVTITTSASDIDFRDYYIQIASADDKGKYKFTRTQLDNDGHAQLKLKRGCYDSSIVKPDEYQLFFTNYNVDGIYNRENTSDLYCPDLCGFYLSFEDESGTPYSQNNITCEINNAEIHLQLYLRENYTLLLVNPLAEQFQVTFTAGKYKSKKITLEPSKSRYQHIKIKMYEQ